MNVCLQYIYKLENIRIKMLNIACFDLLISVNYPHIYFQQYKLLFKFDELHDSYDPLLLTGSYL